MSHFAKIDENNIVTEVIVAEQDFIDTIPGTWIQTSYNTYAGKHYTENEDGTKTESEDQTKALRKNYAGIGYTYDSDKDAFIPPQPYNSWLLNETTCQWKAPTPYPDGSLNDEYEWNEDTTSWELVTE